MTLNALMEAIKPIIPKIENQEECSFYYNKEPIVIELRSSITDMKITGAKIFIRPTDSLNEHGTTVKGLMDFADNYPELMDCCIHVITIGPIQDTGVESFEKRMIKDTPEILNNPFISYDKMICLEGEMTTYEYINIYGPSHIKFLKRGVCIDEP